MSYFQAIVLGLVQGMTEFLPVSSSGHLAIFGRILGREAVEGTLTFNILLHVGTLFSVFFVYKRDIWELIREFFSLIGSVFRGKARLDTPYRRLLVMLVIGTIPAVFSGLLLEPLLESAFDTHIWLVGVALLITALILFISDRIVTGRKDMSNAGFLEAFWVGVFQGVAVIPGISRSGSTITGGLLNGFDRKFAVKFSFLLSIPAILGAVVLDIKDILKLGGDMSNMPPYIIGMVIAAISGIFAIRFLIKLISQKRFSGFAYYCLIAGILTIVLHLVTMG